MPRTLATVFSPPSGSVLIGIVDPSGTHPPYEGNWHEVLRLKFADVGHGAHIEAGDLKAPSRKDCYTIWAFIQKHSGRHIFAHCEAGVSRSGAVREYLSRRGWRVLRPEWQIFPNPVVLSYLERFDREQH